MTVSGPVRLCGCGSPVKSRRLCNACYLRAWLAGALPPLPEAGGTDTEDEALAAHLEAEDALLRATARLRVALSREASS